MTPRVLVTSRPCQSNQRAIAALRRTGYEIATMRPGDAAETGKLVQMVHGYDAMLAGPDATHPAARPADSTPTRVAHDLPHPQRHTNSCHPTGMDLRALEACKSQADSDAPERWWLFPP